MQGYWGICGALIGVALLTAPAHGQDGVAECIQMQSSLQRLDCYDRLFRGPLTAPAETKVNRKAPPPAAKLPPPTPPA
ncbi:MAG: hypothetical protein AAGI06_19200, partial [Pseudomonadota bacterium]